MSQQPAQADVSAGMGLKHDFIAAHKYMTGTLMMVVLLSLAVFLWLKILQPQVLPIKHVRVEGDFIHLSTGELKQIAANVVRGGFFNVNVDGIKKELLQEAWVNNVIVRRAWPDSLIVYITEHQPVARWGDKDLINSRAEIFSPGLDSIPEDLPVLEGPAGSHKLILDQYEKINSMLSAYHLQISAISLNKRRAWRFKLLNGPVVMIGRKHFDERLSRFSEFLLSQLSRELTGAQLIDMRYTNGFTVKWEENPETAVAG